MKNKLIIIAIVSVVFLVWVFFPSEYDRLMNDALEVRNQNLSITTFDGEIEPVMPLESVNNLTILGIDSNKNNIRDDIEIWINRTALDYNERMAMKQYARYETQRLKVCSLRDVDSISEVESLMMKGQTCLSAVSDYKRKNKKVASEIHVLAENTIDRKSCVKYFDSFSYSMKIDGKESHTHCKFEIENKDVVIREYKKFWGYK